MAELVVEEPPLDLADLDLERLPVDEVGLLELILGELEVTSSRGANRACSGSLESTMLVFEDELLNRFIFLARAIMEERLRWKVDCDGRVEASWGFCWCCSCWLGDANVTEMGDSRVGIWDVRLGGCLNKEIVEGDVYRIMELI